MPKWGGWICPCRWTSAHFRHRRLVHLWRRHSPRWARHYAKKAGRYESADQSVQPDFHEAAKNIFVADHAASAIFDSGRFAAFLWLRDISITTVAKAIGAKRQTLRCRASALGASNRRVFSGAGESAITE